MIKLGKIAAISLITMLIMSGETKATDGFEQEKIVLNQSEQEWLQQNQKIKMGVVADAIPYEYWADGKNQGISASYLKIIEKAAGVKFEPILMKDWKESLTSLEQGKVQAVSLANEKLSENKKLFYSVSYVASSLGIFAKDNMAMINNFDELPMKKLAVSVNTASKVGNMVKKKYNLAVFENPADAVKSVADKKSDFFIGDILHTKFIMDRYGLDNLHYVAPVAGSAYEFAMAANEQNKILIGIINKVLQKIQQSQHLQIRQSVGNEILVAERKIVERYLRYLYLAMAVFGLAIIMLIYVTKQRRKKILQLAHMNKMETVGQLAGGIAHDFNNMLAGIQGAAEMIKLKIVKQPELRKYADIIIKACEKSAYLTSRLLFFVRDKKHNFKMTDLHECINDAVALMEQGLGKNVQIKVNLKAKKYMIEGNAGLLQSLLLNLGVNAKDAMHDKGWIEISTTNKEINCENGKDLLIEVKPQEYVELAVKDNGEGIEPKILHKIFEPFFTTKDIGKGTGLGLAAVYGIVQQHKGSIKVETSKQGTTFYLYFPCKKSMSKPKKAKQVNVKLQAKILLIDDEPILLKLMQEILQNAGAVVIATNKAEDAKIIYKNNPQIDLVMLDVIMPEKNGSEVYAELCEINPKVKVIFMSGYNQDEKIEKLLNGKNIDFLNKPCSINECRQKIAKMLAKK